MSNAEDPHCPECGEPIGQQATYCMHCSADLTDNLESADTDDDGAWDQSEQSGADDGGFGGWDQGDDSTESSGFADSWNTDSGGENQASEPQAPGTQPGGQQAPGGPQTAGQQAPGDRTESSPDADPDNVAEATGFSHSAQQQSDPLLDPDGIVDNALTVIVGILAGIVVLIVSTITLGLATESIWALPVGIVIWLGSTAYMVRTRTVQGAIAKAGYIVAGVFLFVPVAAVAAFLIRGNFNLGEIGEVFLVTLIFTGIPAAISGVIGYIASRFVPDENEQF